MLNKHRINIIFICLVTFSFLQISLSDDLNADFSTPEALYHTFIKAFAKNDFDLLLDCYEPKTKEMLGNTAIEQINYLKNNYETIKGNILDTKLIRVKENTEDDKKAEIFLNDPTHNEVKGSSPLL